MHTALLVSTDLHWSLSLARAWVAAGEAVTLVLLDTAVVAARRGHVDAQAIADALAGGVTLAAEERALSRRSVQPDALLDGVKVLRLDEVADLLVDGADKALWL
jgi:intracellular sulfur oxidation DsrE/DsrF family protein